MARNGGRVLAALAMATLAITFVASAASSVVTNYAYDTAGNLTGVSQSCSTTGDTYCVGTDGCYSLSSDASNCGACGNVCASPYSACCGGGCVNTSTDINNCGACGRVCGSSAPYCYGRACHQCPSGYVACCGATFCAYGHCPICQ
jgi:hypothetical protein